LLGTDDILVLQHVDSPKAVAILKCVRHATLLPDPPYTPEDTESVANVIYDFVWQRSASGYAFQPTAAV